MTPEALLSHLICMRDRVAQCIDWALSSEDQTPASSEVAVHSKAQSSGDKPGKDITIRYNSHGWPLDFRPPGSPAGTWPHVVWWHSASCSLLHAAAVPTAPQAWAANTHRALGLTQNLKQISSQACWSVTGSANWRDCSDSSGQHLRTVQAYTSTMQQCGRVCRCIV